GRPGYPLRDGWLCRHRLLDRWEEDELRAFADGEQGGYAVTARRRLQRRAHQRQHPERRQGRREGRALRTAVPGKDVPPRQDRAGLCAGLQVSDGGNQSERADPLHLWPQVTLLLSPESAGCATRSTR